VFKHVPTNRTTATVAKPYFDELGCIIHVDIYYTVCLPEDVPSVSKHVHAVDIVKN
jgi:hypothetical protein